MISKTTAAMQLVSVVIIMVKYFISAADLFIFTFN